MKRVWAVFETNKGKWFLVDKSTVTISEYIEFTAKKTMTDVEDGLVATCEQSVVQRSLRNR